MSWARADNTKERREAENETAKLMNVVNSAISPIDVRNGTFVGGALSHVALEVLVSYIFRRVFNTERRSLVELAAIHTLSVPIQGGMSGFLDGAHPLYLEAPIGSLFADGAKGIPGVFASTYVVNTAISGVHMPKLNFKDILITSASKIASRPIMGMLYENLGNTFRNGQDAVEASFAQQRFQSNLNQPKDDESQ